MRRVLLLLSACSLILLAYGTTYHADYAVFWLASEETMYQFVRLALAGALLLQFFTPPPRSMYSRIICGALAITSFVWVIQETAAFNMMYLDALSILAASIATAITALEISYEKEVHQTSKHIFVS